MTGLTAAVLAAASAVLPSRCNTREGARAVAREDDSGNTGPPGGAGGEQVSLASELRPGLAS